MIKHRKHLKTLKRDPGQNMSLFCLFLLFFVDFCFWVSTLKQYFAAFLSNFIFIKLNTSQKHPKLTLLLLMKIITQDPKFFVIQLSSVETFHKFQTDSNFILVILRFKILFLVTRPKPWTFVGGWLKRFKCFHIRLVEGLKYLYSAGWRLKIFIDSGYRLFYFSKHGLFVLRLFFKNLRDVWHELEFSFCLEYCNNFWRIL